MPFAENETITVWQVALRWVYVQDIAIQHREQIGY
jgi:hypothetical protein